MGHVTPANQTDSGPPGPPPFPIPVFEICKDPVFNAVSTAVVSIFLVLTVVNNALMLMVTWKAARTRINPYFFVSLALSGFLSGVLVLPLDLKYNANKDIATGKIHPYIAAECTFSGMTFHILQTVSLFTFFALSLDRLLTITYPLEYQLYSTKKVNIAIVFLIWFIPALMFGMLPLANLGVYFYMCRQGMCNFLPLSMGYLYFLMLVCVIFFLSTYAINARIFYIAHQTRNQIMALEKSINLGTYNKILPSVRAARSIVSALGVYSVCLLPYYAKMFVTVVFNYETGNPWEHFLVIRIATCDTFLNLFVFLGTYRSFRTTFCKMLGIKKPVDKISGRSIAGLSTIYSEVTT